MIDAVAVSIDVILASAVRMRFADLTEDAYFYRLKGINSLPEHSGRQARFRIVHWAPASDPQKHENVLSGSYSHDIAETTALTGAFVSSR